MGSLDEKPVAYASPYQYAPLPPGDTFRVLALKPGSSDEPLQCSLRTATIAGAEYEAISYVWGSDIKDQRMLCESRTMNITTNLHEALRTLRKEDNIRYLWADSICINQDDPAEKGHQVANMGHIYSSASVVLIYMGMDPEGQGPEVAALLSDVNDFLQSEIAKMGSLEWDTFPHMDSYAENLLLKDERWHCVRSFLDLPWFERGWVVREAGLAREGLIIWGDSVTTWHHLMWVACWYFGKVNSLPTLPMGYVWRALGSHVHAYKDRYSSTLRVFTGRDSWIPTSFLSHLGQGRLLQFRDRRDNIYAFLDFAPQPLRGVPRNARLHKAVGGSIHRLCRPVSQPYRGPDHVKLGRT